MALITVHLTVREANLIKAALNRALRLKNVIAKGSLKFEIEGIAKRLDGALEHCKTLEEIFPRDPTET